MKPAPELYEQRLKSAEKYSEETISSLLGKSALAVEGLDVEVVNEDVQAAAALLEDFIYGKGGSQEESGAAETNGEVAATAEGVTAEEVTAMEVTAMEVTPVEATPVEATPVEGAAAVEETTEGVGQEDLEMKEAAPPTAEEGAPSTTV